MAGASLFPAGLDSDTQLLRRVASDTITTYDHNNLVDAIESIEPVVGMVDDGTAYGSRQFNRSLADHVGLMTTAGPSSRYPYGSPAGGWFGTDNVLPAGWSFGGNMVISYGPPRGAVSLKVIGSTVEQVNKVVRSGWGINEFTMRVRNQNMDTGFVCKFGFSATGTTADLNGVQLGSSSGPIVAGVRGSFHPNPGYIGGGIGGPWSYVRVNVTGTTMTIQVSWDGWTYDQVASVAVTAAGGYFVLAMTDSDAVTGPVSTLWMDFITWPLGD